MHLATVALFPDHLVMLEHVRFILVRPIRSGNVGAVCRALANLGVGELVLVEPLCDFRDEQAQGFAARARGMLERIRVCGSIAEALEGRQATFASSGKGGMYRKQAAVSPREAGVLAQECAAQGASVGVAFGPEDHGLTLSELLEFDRVIEIPTDPGYSAMNLAAAATVIAYELRCAALDATPRGESAEPRASDGPKRVLFERLFQGLERIGFFDGQQFPDHLRFALRRILGRADLRVNECDILIGMAQQLNLYADRHGRKPPPL